MAIPFRNNLDIGLNQLLAAVVETVAADPGSVTNGRVIYNSTENRFKVGEGGSWRTFLITGTRLDELSAPTADLALNGNKISGLADPTLDGDAATKRYVDSVASGLAWKDSVRAATTADTALSGALTVDGVALVAGDRVLVKSQAVPANNGIYVVSAGAWARAADADTADDLEGATVMVEEGTANGNTVWTQTTDNFTLGTGAVAWAQVGGQGAAYTGGNGLTLSGNDFSVNVDGSSLEINADALRVKALGVVGSMIANNAVNLSSGGTQKVTGTLPIANGGTGATTAAAALTALGGVRKFAVDITGTGAATAFTVTHNLGTLDVQVQVWDSAVNEWVLTDIRDRAANTVVIGFGTAPVNGKVYRVVVVG